MPDKRVILVTGTGGAWGGAVAAGLLAQPDLHIIGLDTKPPLAAVPGLDFVQIDLRSALLPELLASEQVDTLVHMAFEESDRPNARTFDTNVTNTIRLFAAAAAAGVRKVVVRSSTAVYGARPDNSAFLKEDHPLHGSRRWGTLRDMVEIESFCSSFGPQAQGMTITVLRLAATVGPRIASPLTRFLHETWAPVLLGFDPLMQVLHEDDGIAAIVHATLREVGGVYNLAAEGPLPLSQLMALAGKVPIPILHWAVYWGVDAAQAVVAGLGRYLPPDPDYLRYPCVADLARMRGQLGFAPRYTAREALREFAGQPRLTRSSPEGPGRDGDEQALRDRIAQRRQDRGGRMTVTAAADTAPEDDESLLPGHAGEADDA